ncbi:MAG: HDOD domain-containing protein [Anaerolineae bacterium]|nr:HDOD domain-containing protein [Anaerolineae bacterium]
MSNLQTSPTANRRLQKILASIDRMRPMPTSVTRVLNALEDGKSNAGLVGELLGLDQALAANVLQAANSAYLGYGPSCTNLTDAVMRLGFGRIRTLVLGVEVSGSLTTSLPGYRLGSGELWNHSVATAVAAQWFARAVSYPNPEDAYVAGLLHDMGKLMLDQFALADYDRLFDLVKNYGLTFYQVEQKLFDVDHAQVGGLMAAKWNFPATLIDAIQHHHSPHLASTRQDLAALVNIANALCPLDAATLARLGKREISPHSLEILKINPQRLEKLRVDMYQYYRVGKEQQ